MNDDDLHAQFRELRQADVAGAPPFRDMRSAARANPATKPRRFPWWIAAAACVAIAAGVARAHWRRAEGRAEAPVVETMPAVLYWQAPTDALLRDSRKLLAGSPTLFGSVLDGVVGGAVSTSSGGT